jgi:hypothetical protein
LAHLYNIEAFVNANSALNNIALSNYTSSQSDLHKSLLYKLSQLPGDSGGKYINPISTSDAIAIIEALKLAAGITGKNIMFKS